MLRFTPKEQSLLDDLVSQEQLCMEKYGKYAADARDGGLKNLFAAIGQVEQGHLNTLNQLKGGTLPAMSGGGTVPAAPSQAAVYAPADRDNDCFLCRDALSMEKYVAGAYNTSIFEFTDTGVRDTLNHIQKEEQKHGEEIYRFMAVNGMY